MTILILIVAVVAAAVIGLAVTSTPAPSQAITVYINSERQTGNYSQANPLTWTGVSPGSTYTKNFTVANSGAESYTLRLYTAEPAGATQTWSPNGTALGAYGTVSATLTLTLGDSVAAGGYTWRLLYGNASAVPTPTPVPSDNNLTCTLDAEDGVQNITVTNDAGDKITLYEQDLPFAFNFTSGDELRFQITIREGYVFNTWFFNDGTWMDGTSILLTNIQSSFNVTARIAEVT